LALRSVSLTAVRRLFGLARPHAPLLALGGLLMLASTAVSLSLPLLARPALNRVLETHQAQALDRLALALAALIVVGAVLGYLQYQLVAYVGNKIVMEMRARLFAHLQRLPVAYFDRTRSGDLASYLSNDVMLLQTTLTDDLVRLVGNVVTMAGGIALAVVIDARLTGIVVGLLLAVVVGFFGMGRRLRKLTLQTLDALAEAMGGMTEVLANIRLVKAFAREPYEDARTEARLGEVLRRSVRSNLVEGGFSTFAFSGFILVLLGVVWYGGRSVLTGHLTAGALLAFLMTIFIISGPMGSFAIQYARLQRALGAAERIFAILDEAGEAPDPPDALPFPEGQGEVSLENVVFAYQPDVPVLQGLTLTLPAGQVTALVGASGAGKTTVALLIYRFYEVQGGQISIDGVALDAIRRRELREHIGLVPQEPLLFNGTIRENIRYGNLDATDAEVEAAARSANVEEFVAPLPEGYETILGERGITLSGGQRQRVAIARAILKDPRILILDEATSALDARSEALVREALQRLMQGRTTLVIAHRLTTIQEADQIVVLEKGCVVETGRHHELLDQGGRYAALYGFLRS